MATMVQTDLVTQDISEPGDAVRASAPRLSSVHQGSRPVPSRDVHQPKISGRRPQVELFGTSKGVIVCAPGRPFRPWFTVPDGCYALVTRFGKDEDYADGQPIWPAGFHFGPPWLKVEFLVTKQSVVFNMPVKGCKTADNVTVQINLAVVFRVMADEAKGENPENAR